MKADKRSAVTDDMLLDYVRNSDKQIWIGYKPPFAMPSVDLAGSSGLRLSDSHHHHYDTVWAYEILLDEFGPLRWKIAVDEMLRLLQERGRLILRMRKDNRPSYIQLKSFLGRHLGVVATVKYEQYDKKNNVWTAVFDIRRLNFEQYLKKDWTFAILTLGDKEDNVISFLRSIRENEPNGNSEIIVVGPQDERYDEFNVKYIDLAQFRDEDYAEIGRKKNAVIERATGTNLLIAHDRFKLAPNFFKGFEKYGYDFDYITVSQYMEDGKEVPNYAATNGYLWCTSQIWVRDYRNLYDHCYISGGLTIFKTATARRIMYNDMLMWGQMEDLEISESFTERGFIPRVNFISQALVLEIRPGFLQDFREESRGFLDPDTSISGGDPAGFHIINRITRRLPRWLKNNWLYQKLKSLYWRGKA